MSISSIWKYLQNLRPAFALIHCAILSFVLTSGSSAEGSDTLFRGTWQIESPENGSLILLLKGQGRASYFWGDNTDRTVYQGEWRSDENVAMLIWKDGSRHRIERNSLGFNATYIDSNGVESYSSGAQQIPEEVLGQWAKPPKTESDELSDRDRARGFFGVWKIGDGADANYVLVEEDRSAASTEGGGDGLRGSWARQGSELHIAWDSGDYSIIRENQRNFSYKRIPPGQVIEADTSEMRPAIRTIEDQLPDEWMANYDRERTLYTGGIAFPDRKTARNFYRGDWIIKLSNDTFEQIEIGRFGGLRTSADNGLGGDWRMQGQDIFMRWDNGMRKILSPIGRGFVLYEYEPARPLDGVPVRIYAAAPAESEKLAEHLQGRQNVAQQIVQLAEKAGIDPSQQEDTGWGRTFARWAWPFGDEAAQKSTEEILQEAYEEDPNASPWWWPFWSENNQADKASESDAANQAEGTGTETRGSDEKKKNDRSIRDWAWPF